MATFHYHAYSVHYRPQSRSCDVEVHLFGGHVAFLESGHGESPVRHVFFSGIDADDHLPLIRISLDDLAHAVDCRIRDYCNTGKPCPPINVRPTVQDTIAWKSPGQLGSLFNYILRLENWFFMYGPSYLPSAVTARRKSGDYGRFIATEVPNAEPSS